ncbi:Pvc16 family protein [Variovorax sp. LjRoot84]|uniref:Pvc16 family protein n=1 Tax=Variovorax sp. LjRoot84 TaxID=3342340 RepID=UPI003ED01D4A
MIHEVTESLEAFLKQPGLQPPLRDAAIRFDRPTDPYALDQTTVNLFLFEVRENLELRSNESVTRRVGGQSFVEPPAYRANCLYLVTAWPVGGTDLPKQEHQLLAQVLQLIAGAPVIPPAFLTPQLQLQEPTLPMMVVQPDGVRNPAEFWAAIGNRIKASLLVSVTVSLQVFDTAEYPSVISSGIRLKTVPGGADLDAPFFRIGGTVLDAASAPVVNAGVSVVERGRSTLTDAEGRFSLSALPGGNFTLRVTAGAVTQDRAIVVPAPALGGYDVQLT